MENDDSVEAEKEPITIVVSAIDDRGSHFGSAFLPSFPVLTVTLGSRTHTHTQKSTRDIAFGLQP